MTVTFSTYVYYVHHTLKMYILIRWSQTYFKNSLSHLVFFILQFFWKFDITGYQHIVVIPSIFFYSEVSDVNVYGT